MPLTDLRLPNASADVVAVFDKNFNQVFVNARPIKAMISEQAKVMEHPIETGAVITDHRIIQPVEIELSLILIASDYRNVYQQIKQLYRAGEILTVQTRTDTYQNMLIQKLPHDEDPEMFDVVALALGLKEAQFVTAQFGTLPASKVRDATDASTTQKGQQTTKTDPNPSILYNTFGG